MKTRRSTPASDLDTKTTSEVDISETDQNPDRHSAEDASDSPEHTGVKWLKYAGIGPNRERRTLSGEDISSLGSLEAEIMAIMWEIGRPATSMEVMEISLYKRRAQKQEPAAFATIATTLRRMTQKGIVVTSKQVHRTPLYAPTVGREEMAARVLNNVSMTLLGQSLHGLLPRLLGNLKPSASKQSPKVEAQEQEHIQRLMQAIEEAASTEEE